MPSPLPSTFASAAAAAAHNTQDASRRDNEWPRRMNGPQTFRRPSLATSTPHSRDTPAGNPSSLNPSSGVAGVGGASTGDSATTDTDHHGGGIATSISTATTSAGPTGNSGNSAIGGSAALGGAGGLSTDNVASSIGSSSPITTSYSKDHLLAIYRAASTSAGWPAAAVADFFLADWNPRVPSVAAAAAAAAAAASAGTTTAGEPNASADDLGPWGKDKDDVGGKTGKTAVQRVGPEICWDHTGGMEPLSLHEMDEIEKELFSTTINSPLKPPPAKSSVAGTPATNATIDSSSGNTPLSLATPSRKSSLAPFSTADGPFTPSSTLSNRPGARRRDTSDTGPLGAASPSAITPGGGAASRFFRGLRERDPLVNSASATGDGDEGVGGTTPSRKDSLDTAFAGLKRGSNAASATGTSGAGGAGAWSGPGGGFSAFGNFSLGGVPGKDGDKRPSLATTGRGESRFKNLLSRDKDGNKEAEKKDDSTAAAAAPSGSGNAGPGDDGWTSVGKTRKMRSETNPFGEDDNLSIPQTTAATSGAGGLQNVRFGGMSTADINAGMRSMDMDMDMPPVQLPSDIQAELSGDSFDISFGLPAGLRELVTDAPSGSGAVTPSGRKNDDDRPAENDPNSPTNTNPYKEGENDHDTGAEGQIPPADDNTNNRNAGAPGLTNLAQFRDEAMGSHPSSPFTGFRRPDVAAAAADRSQTSSTAPNAPGRPFSGLAGFAGGFPGLSGLAAGTPGSMVSSPVTGQAGPAAPGSGSATPTRSAAAAAAGGLGAFNDPIFGNMGAMKGFGGVGGGLGGGMMGMDMNMNMPMNMNMMGGMGGMPGMPGPGIGGMGSMGMGMSPGLGMASQAGQAPTGPVTSSGRQSKMGALFVAAAPAANASTAEGEKGGPDGQTQSRASPFEGATPGQTRTPGGLLNPLGGLDIGGFGSVFGPQGQLPPHLQPPPPHQQIGSPGAEADQQQGSGPDKLNLPASQQRQMVMPDRMRWIYRDPQGNTQGPWSGLEMHDWFKAGFFTAELQVKKLEDEEYEPLAQLVRRIGNSREPFLVPQIGVPHGPEPSQPSQWGAGGAASSTSTAAPAGAPGAASSGTGSAGSTGGIAQPPFAGSFPSFGTTLTADQQNALERRKQEEQYLMARQKEHLAQQQALLRMQAQAQAQAQAQQQQAQQQAQAIGLSPPGVNASVAGLTGPPGGPVPSNPLLGMLGPDMLGGMNLGAFNTAAAGAPDELPGLFDRLNVGGGRGQFPFGGAVGAGAPRSQQQPQTTSAQAPNQDQQQPQQQQPQQQQQPNAHAQNIQNLLQDRARLAAEQEQFDRTHNDGGLDAQARGDRLREFQELRDDQTGAAAPAAPAAPSAAGTKKEETAVKTATNKQQQQQQKAKEAPTLTEQVQKAAAAQQKQQQQQQQAQAQAQAQNQSVWGKPDSNVAAPFPPPPSQSPLPAPSAQRSRSNFAENLAASSAEQMPTAIETAPPVSAPAPPPAAPASIAPWAKDVAEAPKGPSLKEIQEAEARKAAKAEEIAAAARAVAAEQERLNQPPPPAPGLPSTANWASPGNAQKDDRVPGIPATSVWGKQNNKAGAAAPAKKTLAQIQKEEEARKQKFAAQQAAAANAATSSATAANAGQGGPSAVNTGTPAGKRYADLAGKMAQSQPTGATAGTSSTAASIGGGAWTTVGAGGKVKTPAPAPTPAPAVRATPSATVVKPRSVPAAPVKASTPSSSVNNTTRALEELSKWARNALRNGMNSSINVDDFVQQLAILPAESEIISDCVYANSTTLDGRRFGEEYVRRRKLADKGIVESGGMVADQSEGWNEVAKKGPVHARQHDDHPAEFKVVSKKKGKR